MTIETHQANIQGRRLHRLILQPDQPPLGGLVFCHGQGDYIDHYPSILEGFVKAGYRCILTDLPGHGRSPGRRGHVPGLDFIDALLEESRTHLSGPLIIAGHSMGGLMALRLFLRQPDLFQAAWFSSPLLNVIRQAQPWMRLLLPVIAHLLPWITVGTGVTSAQCGDDPTGRVTSDPDEEVLYHSKISVRWGYHLTKAAAEVENLIMNLPSDLPVLFTQGDQDTICPADILKDYLSKPTPGRARVEVIPDARHEPFSGSSREEFLKRLQEWISDELDLTKTPLSQSSPATQTIPRA